MLFFVTPAKAGVQAVHINPRVAGISKLDY